jgi:hypothetical protein
LMSGTSEEGGKPISDAESNGQTATTEKKESTHAAD